MPRASSDGCSRCKRPWTTPNPLIQNPAADNTLKRRGQSRFCQSCYSYCSSDPQYEGLSSAEISTKIDGDQPSYDSGLASFEEKRRAGGRRAKNSDRSTQVTGESRNAVSTKQLIGYLWPQALLKKHGLQDLWTQGPRQTVIHFGKSITGVMRDSQVAAVRSHEVCNRDLEEQDEAEDNFQSMTRQLGGAAKGGGKKKNRSEDVDDFMSIWGVSGSIVSSSGASGSKDKETNEEDTEEAPATAKPPKRPRKDAGKLATFGGQGNRLSGSTLTVTAGQGDDASSQPDAGMPQFGASSSWLFGGANKLRAKGKGGGKGACKELDMTDKVLHQYDSMKSAFANDASFMGITFAKVTTMSEKLQGRSSEDCLKLLRELSSSGSGPETERAMQVMRRLTSAISDVQALCQVVSAVHDVEASAATLLEGIEEAKSAGISTPPSLQQMYHARALTEQCKAQNWQGFFDMLLGDAIEAMFQDGSEQDALNEFQYCSFRSSLSKLLQQEVSLPEVQKSKDSDPNVQSQPISEEEKARREAAKNQVLL